MAECVYFCLLMFLAGLSLYRSWWGIDVAALLVWLGLLIPWRHVEGSWLPCLPHELAFSGFGSPALVMVAGMCVISVALHRTGASILLLGKAFTSTATTWRRHVRLIVVVTLCSTLLNNTTTVLVCMPLVLAAMKESRRGSRADLLFVAYAALLGGQWTLIGTRPNILVADYLNHEVGVQLHLFAFTLPAIAAWICCTLFLLAIANKLLGSEQAESSVEQHFHLHDYVTTLSLVPNSPHIGARLDQVLGASSAQVIQLLRQATVNLPPRPWLRLNRHDLLVVRGSVESIKTLLEQGHFQIEKQHPMTSARVEDVDLSMAESIVLPGGPCLGRTLSELDFPRRHGVCVVGMSRMGQAVASEQDTTVLEAGDALLLLGHERQLRALRRSRELILMESQPVPVRNRRRAVAAIGILAAAIAAAATGILSAPVAIVIAAALMVMGRCLSSQEAYRSLNMSALVVIGAMIPFGYALTHTGVASLIGSAMAGELGRVDPWFAFAATTFGALVLTQFLDNATSTIIYAPIAFETARACDADPVAFLIGCALCISASFATPLAHEVTILVMEPGRYKLRDYLVVGAPLAILVWLAIIVVVPWQYPLSLP